MGRHDTHSAEEHAVRGMRAFHTPETSTASFWIGPRSGRGKFSGTAALSIVMLIQGASQAVVLSDIVTAAAEGAGKLSGVFVRQTKKDRDPLRAMRPASALAGRKVFVAAELFTFGCGALDGALLAEC